MPDHYDSTRSNKKDPRRQKYNFLQASLNTEHNTFLSHYRDLTENITPRRGRFLVTDSNKGDRRNKNIIDSTATMAARTLRAGMMGGITSPARDWKRLSTASPELAEDGDVKTWLHTVNQRMSTVFLKSNLYNVLPIIYGDIGVYGTAAMLIEEDFDDTLRCYAFPVGSYRLFLNSKGQVRGFLREFQLTVRQLIDKFGERNKDGSIDFSNISSSSKMLYERNNLDAWVTVVHIIHPSEDYDMDKFESKPYTSAYYEKPMQKAKARTQTDEDGNKFLRLKGYGYFPILAPRWEVTAEDVYATSCPGMVALGDIKSLQLMVKRRAMLVDKITNPPLQGPGSLRQTRVSQLPGDMNYVNPRGAGDQGIKPLYEIKPTVFAPLDTEIQVVQQRIQRAFYEDLFLMLANIDRKQITAREVDERHEEKLLALGPVLEQLNQDLLDPLIDIAFILMERQGMIPEAPEIFEDEPIKVEYISIMHQAQKFAGLTIVERFAGFTADMAAVQPNVLDKVDTDQLIDEYGLVIGIPPKVVRSDDDVAEMRDERNRAAAAEQEANAMEQASKSMKDMAASSTGEDNVLTELAKQNQAGAI